MKRMAPEQFTQIHFGHAVILGFALCLAACADVGPGIPSTVEAQVQSALPAGDGEVRLLSSAAWFPSANGFANPDGASQASFGLLAITSASVCFLKPETTTSRLELTYRSLIGDLVGIKVDTFGLGRRLVLINSANKTQTFELLDPAGNEIDRKATARAAAMLEVRTRTSAP